MTKYQIPRVKLCPITLQLSLPLKLNALNPNPISAFTNLKQKLYREIDIFITHLNIYLYMYLYR